MDGAGPIRGAGAKHFGSVQEKLRRLSPSPRVQAMCLAAQRVWTLAYEPVPTGFNWVENPLERKYAPGTEARLKTFLASSLTTNAATVGGESDYSAQLELGIRAVGPERVSFGMPLFYRMRPFAETGLAEYPVAPLWKRRPDRSETPLPLGRLLEQEGLVSTIPPVIEAVAFVPIAPRGACPEEDFDTEFDFQVTTHSGMEFWVIKEDRELIRRFLIMSKYGGTRTIQDLVGEDGQEVHRYFKANFVSSLTTEEADRTPAMRGHFVIIAIPIFGEDPIPSFPFSSGGAESLTLGGGMRGGDLMKGGSFQVGYVAISSGRRSGLESRLVDSTDRDPTKLARIIHVKVLGVRYEDEVALGDDIAGTLTFPPLPISS